MSQAECVEELAKHGITLHRQTLHKIETNARPLKLDEAVRISSVLASSDLDFMLRGSEEFRLLQVSSEIEVAYFDALKQVERLYRLQISLARMLDSGRYEGVLGENEGSMWDRDLARSANSLHEHFVSRLHKWKELRDKPANDGLQEDLRDALPNYFEFTIPNYSKQGKYMQKFLDAHPELKRETGNGDADDAAP